MKQGAPRTLQAETPPFNAFQKSPRMNPTRPLPTNGFYAILDTGYTSDENWLAKGTALIRGGAALIQIRAKNRSPNEVFHLANGIAPIAKSHGVPLIINDHLEVALQIENAGLHVGQDDLSPREAREQLGPSRILGLSTHSEEQIKKAVSIQTILSYFAVGPIFPTGTKPDYTPVGLSLVQFAVNLHPQIPFFCIGGINRINLKRVLDAGAQGLVAVSDPLLDPDTRNATSTYVDTIRRANA